MPLFLEMLRSETAAEPQRTAAALAGLAAYQTAERPAAPPPKPALATAGRASLRYHGGRGRMVVFVPSLINPPAILDLGEASLVRWIAAQGYRTALVDWGSPGAADRDMDMTAHIESLLVPLIEQLDEPPVLVGYCLGGTMALAAACATRVAGLATIAAPWRFAGYGAAASVMLDMWHAARPTAEALGVLPMEVLQAGFWRLDPARTIAKYEAFGRLDPGSDAARSFVRLEDWANAGEPLPLAAARHLFEAFIARDLPGTGGWRVRGAIAAPERLACPAVEFVSATDRIVPAATAAGLADRRDLALGHVGMIVGSRAQAMLWAPLAHWIARLPAGTGTSKE
ncbi:alpha/beta hydrolase [Sphingomonas sp. A2-49]|uniref:alpha/beta fold hydrolase n=1 Tax=Sphingomonas sp. A2-49 TaxID=1391375 RepID=UPI0021D03240|nr:alpha/beta fold hydrolase [Sphingomonas sp. A2-49]MCU6454050.1 alpha/beta hydrolase [Sphingomonas sp. A2-49]